MKWEESSEGHDLYLPPALARRADDVLHDLKFGVREWRLRLSPEAGLVDCDLSGLSVEPDSAWVPLAAGLLLAADRIDPRPGVWATGSWDAMYGGVNPVGGIAAKLNLARSWHTPAEVVYVPAGNVADVRTWAAAAGIGPDELAGLVRFLDGVERDPAKALRPLLADLGAPPTLDGSMSEGRSPRARRTARG